MIIQPYLDFNGRADEAIEFYKARLGAKVQMLMRHRENPEPPADRPMPAAIGEKVMHAALKIGSSTIFLSDGRCTDEPRKFSGFMLSVTVDSEEEAGVIFNGVSDGGEVFMPLAKTFFSPRFGMATDRFGVTWMVMVGQG